MQETAQVRITARATVAKYHNGRTPADGEPDEIVEIDDTDLTDEQVNALLAGMTRREDHDNGTDDDRA